MSRKRTVSQYEAQSVRTKPWNFARVGYCLEHKSVSARLIYIRRHGTIPAKLCVCHKCDNRRCIRDEHHFLGRHVDNIRDSIAKGRFAGKAWRAAVSARVKKQHKQGKFGQATWSEETKAETYRKIGRALLGRPGGRKGKKATSEQRKHYHLGAIKREAGVKKRRLEDLEFNAKFLSRYSGPNSSGWKWSDESRARMRTAARLREQKKRKGATKCT